MDTLNAAIAKTTLPVEDLARAKAFYAEKLGLRPTREVEGTLFYEGDGTTGFLLFLSGGRPSGHLPRMPGLGRAISKPAASLRGRASEFEEYDSLGLRPTHGPAAPGTRKDGE